MGVPLWELMQAADKFKAGIAKFTAGPGEGLGRARLGGCSERGILGWKETCAEI